MIQNTQEGTTHKIISCLNEVQNEFEGIKYGSREF